MSVLHRLPDPPVLVVSIRIHGVASVHMGGVLHAPLLLLLLSLLEEQIIIWRVPTKPLGNTGRGDMPPEDLAISDHCIEGAYGCGIYGVWVGSSSTLPYMLSYVGGCSSTTGSTSLAVLTCVDSLLKRDILGRVTFRHNTVGTPMR